ncbi:MAG: hypothetical protein AAFQ98_16490 [Bacteroidota bacterium]
MRWLFGIVFLSPSLLWGQNSPWVQQGTISLTPPLLTVDSAFFYQQATYQAKHPMAEAAVHCQWVSSDSVSEIPAEGKLSADAELQCTASHPDFLTSAPATLSVRKLPPHTAWSLLATSTPPNEKYAAEGLATLRDHRSPTLDYQKHWLGYYQPKVELQLQLDAAKECERVSLSSMVDHRTWIFEPTRIELWDGETLLSHLDITPATEQQKPHLRMYDLLFDLREVTSLSVRIHTTTHLPAWHPGNGYQGWFFVDEILID